MTTKTKDQIMKIVMVAGQCCLLLSVFAFLDRPIAGIPTGTKTGIILVAIWLATGAAGVIYAKYLRK